MEESGLLAYLGWHLGWPHLESAVFASLPSVVSHHAVGLSIADVDLGLLHRSLEEGSTGQTGLMSGLMILFPFSLSPLTLAP